MFTGIIEAVGRVLAREDRRGDARLRVAAGGLDLGDVRVGDSIAVNGVCLTAVELPGDGFWADVSAESLSRTTLGALRPGDPVNLEKALTPTSRLGGHLVAGHVDGVGRVLERRPEARSVRFVIEAPRELARYIAEKGSIAVDGVSLTVNRVEGARFDLNIVPHTIQGTTIDQYQPGRPVNLEVDVIARHLERLLLGDRAAEPAGGVTLELLARHGFVK
ncbi:MAG: riboflavin synthase [Gammaproteobacteria bacterium]|nr:riboflavin synthase [Gammaproteobacteria bacterium]